MLGVAEIDTAFKPKKSKTGDPLTTGRCGFAKGCPVFAGLGTVQVIIGRWARRELCDGVLMYTKQCQRSRWMHRKMRDNMLLLESCADRVLFQSKKRVVLILVNNNNTGYDPAAPSEKDDAVVQGWHAKRDPPTVRFPLLLAFSCFRAKDGVKPFPE